jgi:hypothetical protein
MKQPEKFRYATMTPSGSYGATVEAMDVKGAIQEAERMGYKVLDVTDGLRNENRKGNPEGWLLVIEED